MWAKNGQMAIVVAPLQTNEFDDGLVLAQLGHARSGADVWRHELEAFAKNPVDGGALLARNEAGRACGLILYRIIVMPDDQPTIQVLRLVAFDLMDPGPIADSLVKEAFRLARGQGCRTLSIVQPLTQSADIRLFVLKSHITELHSLF